MYVCVRELDPLELLTVVRQCRCWELNPGPREKQPVLRTSEPPLQPWYLFLVLFLFVFWNQSHWMALAVLELTKIHFTVLACFGVSKLGSCGHALQVEDSAWLSPGLRGALVMALVPFYHLSLPVLLLPLCLSSRPEWVESGLWWFIPSALSRGWQERA